MKTKIACVSCGDFFEPEPQEVRAFIAYDADEGFLWRVLSEIKRYGPIPPEYRQTVEKRKEYLAIMLMAYCPYCRTVKFGKAACPDLPRGRLSETKYIRALRREINKNGGFQIKPIPDDYVSLVDDEN